MRDSRAGAKGYGEVEKSAKRLCDTMLGMRTLGGCLSTERTSPCFLFSADCAWNPIVAVDRTVEYKSPSWVQPGLIIKTGVQLKVPAFRAGEEMAVADMQETCGETKVGQSLMEYLLATRPLMH